MFENEAQHTGGEVDKMLERLKTRIDAGKVDKTDAEKTVGLVVDGIVKAKDLLDKNFNFKDAPSSEIADLSNAWKAWQETGVFKGDIDPAVKNGLKDLLSLSDSTVSAKLKRFARQMWRTEMATYIVEKMKATDRSDRADVMERVMAGQIVTEQENDPGEALRSAMWLEPQLRDVGQRKILAGLMERSVQAGGVSDIQALFGNWKIKNLKVVVGGEFLAIPEGLREKFEFKNMVFFEGKIYAQMKNGCRGNLVIIDVEEGTAVPPPGPGPGPVNPPPGPEPHPPEPHELPTPTPYPTWDSGDRSQHLRVTTRSGDLVPSAQEFNQLLSPDIMSHNLIDMYHAAGLTAFIQGIDSIPPEKQKEVLQNVFKTLVETGHEDTMRELLYEVVSGAADELHHDMIAGLDEAIKTAKTPDEKSLWEIQKIIVEGSLQAGYPDQIKIIFEKLNSIKPAALPPELKEMYETERKYLEFFMKGFLANSIVDEAIHTADQTFGDKEGLKELVEKYNKGTLSDALNNRGFGEWTNTDAEVYMASSHVLDALKLALKYQYPQDMKRNYKVDNPVRYYYWKIKTGALTTITVPPGPDVPPIDFTDSLGRKFSGMSLDLNKLFVDRAIECGLFEKYEHGKESFGTHSVYNWEGSAGAFMGEDIGMKGILAGSDGVFGGDYFEKNGMLGGVEKVYIAKIKTLYALKRYDEARDLCVEVLKKRFAEKKPVDENSPEVSNRATELSKKWMTKVRAQARLQLEARGITNNSQVVAARIQKLDGSGTEYTDLEDIIQDYAKQEVRKRAYIQLQGEVGETIFDANTNMNQWTEFERQAFSVLKEMNGYGAFDMNEETVDTLSDAGIVVGELIVIEFLTAGVGAFFQGAATVGAAASVADVGVAGARGVEAARWAGATSRMRLLGESAANARYGRFLQGGRWVGRGVNYMGGTTRGGVAIRTGVHSLALTEAQGALHGQMYNPLSWEGAYIIGTTAFTLWGLDKVSQFARGTMRSAEAVSGAAPATGLDRLSIVRNMLGRPSAAIGARTNAWIARGGIRYGVVSAGEIAAENVALNTLDGVQTELAVWLTEHAGANLMTRTQAEASEEPEAIRRYAHTFAITLGLRTWRHLKGRMVEPTREPLLLKEAKQTHDVDIVAKAISENRGDGLPKGKIKIGEKEVTLKMPLTLKAEEMPLKDWYEKALRIPDEPTRKAELAKLDRLLASRMILATGGIAQYPAQDQAERAKAALEQQYPNRVVTVYKSDIPDGAGGRKDVYYLDLSWKEPLSRRTQTLFEKGKIGTTTGAEQVEINHVGPSVLIDEIPAHDVDIIAKNLSDNRFNSGVGIPKGEIKIGGKMVTVDHMLEFEVGGTKLKAQYEEALKIESETARADKLKDIDRLMAERLILSEGGAVEYPNAVQAKAAFDGFSKELPGLFMTTYEKGGKFYVAETIQYSVDSISQTVAQKAHAASDGVPRGNFDMDGMEIPFETILKQTAGGVTLENLYKSFHAMTDSGGISLQKITLNQIVAERLILARGGAIGYAHLSEAEAARAELEKDFSGIQLEIVSNRQGHFLKKKSLDRPLDDPQFDFSEFKIGDRRVYAIRHIARMSLRELESLTPAELEGYGIKTKDLGDFEVYKNRLREMNGIEKNLATSRRRKLLVQLAPELDRALILKMDQLPQFVDNFNKKYTAGFRDESFSVIQKTDEGILAFDAEGKLKIYESREMYDAERKATDIRSVEFLFPSSKLSGLMEGKLNAENVKKACEPVLSLLESTLGVKKPIKIKVMTAKEYRALMRPGSVESVGDNKFILSFEDANNSRCAIMQWGSTPEGTKIFGTSLFSLSRNPEVLSATGGGFGRAFIQARENLGRLMSFEELQILPDNMLFWRKIFMEESGLSGPQVDNLMNSASRTEPVKIGRWTRLPGESEYRMKL